MRILYHPQVSMRSYVDSRWLLSSDAQITKMRAYVEAMPPDWEHHWLLPQTRVIDSNKSLLKLLPANVDVLNCSWMDNVLEGRFHFDMRDLQYALSGIDPQVLLLEVPEHARAWRVLQRKMELDFPIVSMVEHVDLYQQTKGIVPEHVSYYLRQIDGALVSDAVAFPLEGMRATWMQEAQALGLRPDIIEKLREKTVVWNAIYSPNETAQAFELTPTDEWQRDERPVINFISRLSDNGRTAYEQFFQACRELSDEREFEVWVQNPNDAKSLAWVREQGNNISRVGNAGRASYLCSLWRSDIVPILYPQSHIYSLGYCEAITAGNIILSQEPPDGPEIPAGLLIRQQTVEDIMIGLRAAMDIVEGKNVVKGHLDMTRESQREWLMENRSVERNIGAVVDTIASVIR